MTTTRSRGEKVIEINGKKITIKEITINQLLEVKDGGIDQEKINAFLDENIGLKYEDLINMYPSELSDIWKTFTEVNDFFLKILNFVGVEKVAPVFIPLILEALGGTFGREFVSFLNAVIMSQEDTDSNTSVEQ